MSVPPPIPPRPPGYELRISGNPPLPPRRPQQPQQQDHEAPPPPRRPQNAWGPLSNPDGTATPLLEALLAAFFARLDPQGTGTITPEALSAFLDVHGFPTQDNIWKLNLKPSAMFQPEDLADYELKAACEAWGFEHRVVTRNPTRAQLPYGGMPLLTVRGFTDMMAVEYGADPNDAFLGLNTALCRYGVWVERGPLPRECLLPGPDAPEELRRRTEEVRVRSRRVAEERLEATRVRFELQARGRRHAEELSGDYHYVRRDFW
ncbi:uncharacterized protein GGS22DRAFT_99519 [Annulohypoxylon maeteangense]|uniref:uncharacterized protein n=1 Tax=Annulohypoxylon maeteangense TaxID=1927788 RepID=UPI002007CBBE|nr:uncharacterized protein GGS22DRAFT_99519 [Annulohypoxylon maeteangense]KAI0880084.1 hypothetical protein GGS22DRAFT_99519 [Annulohypoxylon maeteangense]